MPIRTFGIKVSFIVVKINIRNNYPMTKWILMPLAALLLLAGSCANDINTNADYKEIMVIYGLLNKNDTTHYVRVSRAFLTENQSALEVAKVLDTAYLNGIEVKIDEYEVVGTWENYKATYNLVQDKTLAKDTGIFANYPNILFSFSQKLDSTHLYKLTVTNKNSGKVATAQTYLVNDPTLGVPNYNSSKYLIDTARNLTLNWTGGKNSKVHDLTMRFYWNEYDKNTNQLVAENVYIDWPMVQDKSVSNAGTIRSNLAGSNFFSYIVGLVPVKQNIYRVPQKIDFTYWAADEQFDLYRSVNKPSVGIVQKRPEYTNISNGNYGLFASRNRLLIENVTISDKTIENLQTYSLTRSLNFRP